MVRLQVVIILHVTFIEIFVIASVSLKWLPWQRAPSYLQRFGTKICTTKFLLSKVKFATPTPAASRINPIVGFLVLYFRIMFLFIPC